MKSNITGFFVNLKEIILTNGPALLISLIVLIILHFIVRAVMKKVKRIIIKRASSGEGLSNEKEKRINTISSIFTRTVFIILWGIGILIILSELQVNIAPLLTGVGIFGLALSFGAQSLVKDIISGIFILFEDQIRVGDVAIINGTGGLVEQINLRTTILRDVEGVVHIFPNGSINTLSNRTREWSACVIDVGIAYKEDPEKVMDVMKEVDEELRADEEFGPMILEPLEIFGLDEFADSAIIIKARYKTQPLKQWAVSRQFKLLLKKAFDRDDIEIPFPHVSLYFGEVSKPVEVNLRNSKRQKKAKK